MTFKLLLWFHLQVGYFNFGFLVVAAPIMGYFSFGIIEFIFLSLHFVLVFIYCMAHLFGDYLIDSPSPLNLSYFWSFGSLLGATLLVLLLSGVSLAMHYSPNTEFAFASVEELIRAVHNGWLFRYVHANGASLFFIWVYLHIGRNLFYGSYRHPRGLLWLIGVMIFIAMMATAFIGYVLPWGQMSLWGATVITNLLSAIPLIGSEVVAFIWGGYSVDNPTLNRFFSLALSLCPIYMWRSWQFAVIYHQWPILCGRLQCRLWLEVKRSVAMAIVLLLFALLLMTSWVDLAGFYHLVYYF